MVILIVGFQINIRAYLCDIHVKEAKVYSLGSLSDTALNSSISSCVVTGRICSLKHVQEV